MSPVFDWFTSPAWSRLVETLLHSLWQGAILAVGLAVGLRFISRPGPRYRLALLALAGMLAANLVTWAVLQQPGAGTARPQSPFLATHPPALAHSNRTVSPSPVAGGGETSLADAASPVSDQEGDWGQAVPSPRADWSAGLAVMWLLGTVAMLARAGVQVAGAGRVRRECHPLPEGPVHVLLGQIQKSLGMARRIRVLVTNQLTSPAVVGVLVPVLILPVSLITTLSGEQLRFILLHELAHIQRADYLVNVLQLLVEALLFFNPAVWWISRQIRLEREACCDAMASELSGAPVEYARTLLHVAECYARPGPVAAMAFGDQRTPSRLAERIHRLLSPNHRPRLRLTWGAMLGALVAGGGLLVLSALGTRLAVAAILTPQQRMDRIEKLLVQQGEDVTPMEANSTNDNIFFSGHVRTEDGSPLPKWLYIYQELQYAQGSTMGTCDLMKKGGAFEGTCRSGRLTLSADAPGYAPCIVGPLMIQGTNAVTGIEMVLRRGFAVTIQMVDADSGAPLSNAPVTAHFSTSMGNLADRNLTTDFQGGVVMTNCASLPVDLTGNAAGYEIVQQSFPALTPNETLRLATRRGLMTSGLVLDKITGQPIAGASIRVVHQQGARENSYSWDSGPAQLTTTDPAGNFSTTGLRQDSRYDLAASAPGHESVVFKGVLAGDSNLVGRLGPELIVHGRVTGDAHAAIDLPDCTDIRYTISDPENHNSYEYQALGRITNGAVYFEFTNPAAGPVVLNVAGLEETRIVDAPVADWLVVVANNPAIPAPAASALPGPMREVVVRLKSPDGVPLRGIIDFEAATDPNNPHVNYPLRKPIQNGEARLKVPVDARIEYSPDKATLGYWFESTRTNVMPGNDPIVIDVPVIPAGIIAARARNADGSPAGDLNFSIIVLKPSPAVKNRNLVNYDRGDSHSGNGPRRYLTPPLPLGGTYEIVGWRGNSFCSSGPIKLTAENPDQSVDLQFPPGEDITGSVVGPDGQPIRGVSITVDGVVGQGHGYGLGQAFTAARGEFRLVDCSPQIAVYSLSLSQAGMRTECVKVDFHRLPLTVQLQPGVRLTGRIVEAATGYVIPNAEMRAYTDNARWPSVTTRSDADGNYEFNTLADATYRIWVDGADFSMIYDKTFRAGVVTNLLLKVTPYPGSNLEVRRP